MNVDTVKAKSTMLQIRIPNTTDRQLREVAQTLGLDRSAVARALIMYAFHTSGGHPTEFLTGTTSRIRRETTHKAGINCGARARNKTSPRWADVTCRRCLAKQE